MVNDPFLVDDAPIYVQQNKKAKQAAKNNTQASRSKGKSLTGRKSQRSLNIYHMLRYLRKTIS